MFLEATAKLLQPDLFLRIRYKIKISKGRREVKMNFDAKAYLPVVEQHHESGSTALNDS